MAESGSSFQPGDLVVPPAEPFIKVVNPAQKGRICDNCFYGTENLKKCTKCKSMHYCGVECQKQDWLDGHIVECKSEIFRNLDNKIEEKISFLPIILRTLGKFHRNPESFSRKHVVYGSELRSFYDLVWHDSTISGDESRLIDQLFKALKRDSKFREVEFNEEFLKRIYGVVQTNSFLITSTDGDGTVNTGVALTIETSVFNHSCRPNCVTRGTGIRTEIRCIHPIQKGEEPFISYTRGLNLGLEARRERLMGGYNFLCKCELCTEEEGGQMVDYSQLPLNSQTVPEYKGREEDFIPWITKHKEDVMQLYRKLYYEYDVCITNACFAIFKCIHKMLLKYRKLHWFNGLYAESAEDLETRLNITLGVESWVYRTFLDMIAESAESLGYIK